MRVLIDSPVDPPFLPCPSYLLALFSVSFSFVFAGILWASIFFFLLLFISSSSLYLPSEDFFSSMSVIMGPGFELKKIIGIYELCVCKKLKTSI